ncbi:MAG: tape measure protein, partial [Pseudomonadales bacterium]|nr:tape measure protein [Pseudomonadales bacterium]
MSRRIVAEFDAVTGPFLQKMDRIDRSIGQFERNAVTGINRVERGINGLANSASRLRNITGIIATGFGANLATQFLDKAALIRNAMREAGDTSQETFEEVFRSSVRALAGFDTVAQGVQRFQKALRDRQDVQQTIRDVETLNKLLALGGKTTQERASTFIQFSQALQAGYLQGEELRAVRENAPFELVKEIAEVAGGGIEDLKDFAREGKLTTDVMITAIRNLEKEADERFGNIRVTIQDAAQVFRSGAIVASEGFDEGLGLSRATVTTLKNVGEILGENGEAALRFGEAVKVAGAVMLTSFAGRRISNVAEAYADHRKELYANAAALEANAAKTAKASAAARARVATTEASVNALRAKGASEAAVTAAMTRHERAVRRATQATSQHVAAVTAADAAQKRLLLSTRLTAGAMGLLRGAVAFMGGIPGIILTAVTA